MLVKYVSENKYKLKKKKKKKKKKDCQGSNIRDILYKAIAAKYIHITRAKELKSYYKQVVDLYIGVE